MPKWTLDANHALQFGSSKSSPQLTKHTLGTYDGANEDAAISDVSVGSVESEQSSGSSTPTPRGSSPPSQESPMMKTMSPQISRSTSPNPRTGSALGSRTESPVSFGYPYHQSSQNGFFSEGPASAAIHG